jgi:CheY-like chemotaxis protein
MMQRQLERLAQTLDGLPARHGGVPQQEASSAPESRTASSAQRILVVDDNQDAARSLAMLLKALGADAQVAHDGPQALDMVPSYRPSAVLLDIGMPGMDGYEVARRIRERETGFAPVLVALTGRGQAEEGRRAEQAGFDHHFVKPADLPALQSLLASLPAQRPGA